MNKNLFTLAISSTVLTTVLVSSAFAAPQDTINLKQSPKLPIPQEQYRIPQERYRQIPEIQLKQPPQIPLIPLEQEFPRFLGTSTRLDDNEALSNALEKARQVLSRKFPGDEYGSIDPNELNYQVLNRGRGRTRESGTMTAWVVIELVPNTQVLDIPCPQPTEPGLGRSCQPQVRTSYLRDPRRVPRNPRRR
jgi:hypothetical protein